MRDGLFPVLLEPLGVLKQIRGRLGGKLGEALSQFVPDEGGNQHAIGGRPGGKLGEALSQFVPEAVIVGLALWEVGAVRAL
jgi:hypothetical protein